MLTDDEGDIAALGNGPDLDAWPGLLICAIEQLLMASIAAAAYFDFDFVDYWKEEHETLRLLVEAEQRKTAGK